MSIYEVHLGSWRPGAVDATASWPSELADYVADMGFTHVELMPVMEHPFRLVGLPGDALLRADPRYGTPDDFRFFVDRCTSRHRRDPRLGAGALPARRVGLARFDGTALYEHADPRQGEHPDWGTLIFNYGRNEVRNFLIANALYWLASTTSTACAWTRSRRCCTSTTRASAGEWMPNQYGGRENLEAIEFLREFNDGRPRRRSPA